MTPLPITNAPRSGSPPGSKKTLPIPQIILATPITWLATLALLLVVLEPTPLEIKLAGLPLDLWLQDRFYDFAAGTWLIDRKEPVARFFCYNGPKTCLIIPLVSVLAMLLFFPKKFWGKRNLGDRWFTRKKRIVAVLLCTAVIALGCNQTKAISNTYCPYEITRYGGHAPYVRVFEKYPAEFYAYQKANDERGRGFPAGHASGGFAMMSLALLARNRRRQIAAVLFGIASGWVMGGYQMLRGAHYLSHTLVTWCVAAIVVAMAAKLLRRTG